MDNINTQWREKFKKRYILLFLFFVFGAYAFMTSVLTRGQIQETPENAQVITEDNKKTEPTQPPLVPQVLGDKDFAVDWNVRGTKANTNGLFGNRLESYDQFLDKNTSEITVKDGEVKLIPVDAPKIVLGYKEGFNEAWDVCDNLSLAQSFGFNTTDCRANDQTKAEPEPIAYNRGSGGFSGESTIEDPAAEPEENVEPEQEPEDDPVVYASSSQAILTSFKIGSQEVMGKRGSQAMSRTEISYKSGVMLQVVDPYTFTGVELETSSSSTMMVYIYQDGGGWSTWDLQYPGAREDLANFVLKNKAVVVVKVVSEDFSTVNWYKAKVFDPNQREQIPAFLTKFEVGNRDVLPLLGLSMDYHSLNQVDFGASLLVPDFTDFKGVVVDLDNWDNFVEAKVLIYRSGWSTWDLKYPGAIENLANTPINKDEIIILKLKDTGNNNFYYRVNVFEGLEEAIEVSPIHEQELLLNSDSSLKTLLVGNHDILALPGAYLGPDWAPTSTGAVLNLESIDDLVGVIPVATEAEKATIKVLIFRNYWITWEYEVGLEMVAKENILFGDKIVVEVTAEDGSKSYYQVEITKKLKVHENNSVLENLSNQELAKPKDLELEDSQEIDIKDTVKEEVIEIISTEDAVIESVQEESVAASEISS